ncbi:MAG: 2-amino-4-hydroxy-6-hydroxymethyldihydropteridine diphosphokinase [Clostridiales bacterium]|nr:2-amino-4-hydroxy-6-hydroxymethyldihydropteridine diphosphokinase [Clostridiales bacterium]
MNEKHFAVLSLGSNLGDREGNLRSAVRRLMESGHATDLRCASLYETEPVGYDDQPYFLNTCVSFYTDLSPHDLLDLIHGIENDLLRVRTIKNGPRTVDLDILLYDDLHMADETLIIPHPRMYERAFVLYPLKELIGTDVKIPDDKSVVKTGPFEV